MESTPFGFRPFPHIKVTHEIFAPPYSFDGEYFPVGSVDGVQDYLARRAKSGNVILK